MASFITTVSTLFFFLLFSYCSSTTPTDKVWFSLSIDENSNIDWETLSRDELSKLTKAPVHVAQLDHAPSFALGDNSSIAWAYYIDSIETLGWAQLYIETNSSYSDRIQMWSAGYLEAALTYDRIYQLFRNFVDTGYYGNHGDHVNYKIYEWLKENLAWMETQIAANASSDPYWAHVGLVLDQVSGLTAGYNHYHHIPLSYIQQIFLSAQGDDSDIATIVDRNLDAEIVEDEIFTEEEYMDIIFHDHCSALIKPSPNFTELFSAHTTWSFYNTMLRIYKIYNFPLSEDQTSSQLVSFSGYPSTLCSTDDFYITDSGLAIIETTNGILNWTLYKSIVPQSILSWLRTIVANRMATSGPSWIEIFSKFNSGTYNNQWMVVDYNLFTPGQPLQPGTLWICEQIPNLVESADVTDIVLSQGYWPSYNVPYFPNIYNISGFGKYAEKYGDGYSYSNCPRALIFQRDQDKVNSLSTMQWIMRENDYKNDPLSLGSPGNAISSRFDLIQGSDKNAAPLMKGACFGGLDSKVTSYELIKSLQVIGQSGPTWQTVPVFNWTEAVCDGMPHYGQPETFMFPWVLFQAPIQ